MESRCSETLWSRVYLTFRRRSILLVTATRSHCGERNKLGIFRMLILSSRWGSCARRGHVLLNNMSLLMLRSQTTFSTLISGTVTITGEDKSKSDHCFIVAEEAKHTTTEQSDYNQMNAGDTRETSMPPDKNMSPRIY